MSDKRDEPKRYGISQDEHTGAEILWETADSLPFTHIAQVFNGAAWNRYLSQLTAEVRREAAAEQREKDAQIAVSMTDNEPDGYYGRACHEAAAAIREQGTADRLGEQ